MRKQLIFMLVTVLSLVFLVGCGCEHQFGEATCTSPATCVKCGETSGDMLGHTCEIGKCSRCGVVQGNEVLSKINAEIENGISASYAAINCVNVRFNNDDELYTNQCNAVKQYEDAAYYFDRAAKLCEGYEDLEQLKDALNKAVIERPQNPKSKSHSDLMSWVDDFEAYGYTVSHIASYLD